jgi:hypothetical protein
MRGTKATLKILQGPNESFKPVLYIIPNNNNNNAGFEKALQASVQKMQSQFEGVGIEKTKDGYKVAVPAKFNENHEEHFARVVQAFLGYLDNNNMPNLEVHNMIAKFFTTSSALKLAQSKK